MTVLRFKCVVFGIIFSSLLRTSQIDAAECDLEKIFRTPKDMSKVNFDHLEIVERNGFEQVEPTIPSTTEAPPTVGSISKRNGPNVANAQVLVRFGGDDIQGSNHIMKIPPQCRNHIGNSLIHPPDFYYPPPPHGYSTPCDPRYYHPYPPPVPYVFPNYYFCNYADEPQYLPSQLREYLRRHPEFFDEGYQTKRTKVFVRGKPVRREDIGDYYGDHTDFVNARKIIPIFQENPNPLLPNVLAVHPKVAVLQSRIDKPLNISNEEIENLIEEKSQAKGGSVAGKKEFNENPKLEANELSEEIGFGLREIAEELENNEIFQEQEKPNKPDNKAEQCKQPNQVAKDLNEDDVAMLLNKALVAYKCQNCSTPPKMLVSYPINNRLDDEPTPILTPSECPYCTSQKPGKFSNDVDSLVTLNTENVRDGCKCPNCHCHKNDNDKKLINDLDDLVAIVVTEIVDPVETINSPPPLPEVKWPVDDFSSLFPPVIPPLIKLAQIGLDLARTDYQSANNIPLKATFNLDLADHNTPSGYVSTPHHGSTSHHSHLECNLPRPQSIVVYPPPPELNTLHAVEESLPVTTQARFTLPDSSVAPRNIIPLQTPLPKYLKVVPTEHNPVILRPKLGGIPIRNQIPNHYTIEPIGAPNYYFFPEPNVSIQSIPEPPKYPLPQYFKVIPRNDFQVIPPSDIKLVAPFLQNLGAPQVNFPPRYPGKYCPKCGLTHCGGNICEHCGSSVVVYPPARPYCPTCPKETRQLNDW